MLEQWYILDADNNAVPVDMMTWARWRQDHDPHIGYQMAGEAAVSTVFLGLDHRHFGAGPPLIFETMIFGGPLDQEQWRYSSFDDAQTGHAMAVKKARAAHLRARGPFHSAAR